MIKIYIHNYFIKKKKLIITNRWNCTNNRKIKGIRQCIIIVKKQLSLIDKTENKLESSKNKILPQFNCLLDPLAVIYTYKNKNTKIKIDHDRKINK